MVFDCRNLGGFLYKPRQLGIRGLSTFLAKIDVARALDLIDDAIYKDLRAKPPPSWRASSVQVLLTDRHMQKIRKKGGENSRKYLSKRLVK